MFQSTFMSGQRILVTGGGSGLGQAMAARFLSAPKPAASRQAPPRGSRKLGNGPAFS